MSKIVRYEFVGSWPWLLVLAGSYIGFPLALVYMLYSTVRIETEMDNPEEIFYQYRAGKLKEKSNR